MATVGALGGSQLDVQGLVSQLISAERATYDRQISRDSARVTTQISAVGTLMGAMSQFRTALSSLKTVDVFSTRSATSADEQVFKVTAGSKAAPGSYDVEVVQLAKAHQISSNAFADGAEQVVGTGTLTLTLGEQSFSIDIDDSNSTLAGIRDAINKAANNPGIRATLIHGEGGSRLVLTAAKTGAENAIAITQTGGDGGLAALTYGAGNTDNYTEIAAAQDAIVNIANVQVTSSTNTVSNAIDGVTLTLIGVSEEGASTQLTVDFDRAGVSKRVETFVSAYNALMSQISRLRSYDAATQSAGPMLGDSLLTSIESQIRRTISDAVAGAGDVYNTLASVGITTDASGQLALDTAKLNKALDSNFESVGKLFASEEGIASRLFAQMDAGLKSDGALEARSQSLVDKQKDIADKKLEIDARMEARYKAYIAQFTRLDTLLSQLQVTSSYLTQQIEALGNFNKAASK
jgi:flagellar hook-associated protein 2